MKKMSFLSLLTAGVMSLSLVAPFSAHAAEAGEVSIGEPPIMEETSIGEPPLAPAITMTPEGEVIYSPEETPEEIPEPILIEEPIVGGRSERIAYLRSMRYYYAEGGEDRPLWEYVEWLITEGGWDTNGWLWELLEEAFPGESTAPNPTPAPEDPIVWKDGNRCGLEDFTVEYIEEEVEANEPETSETEEPTENVEPEYPAYSILGDPGMEYIVMKGDNLWKIADKVYGDGNCWIIIATANADKISNPSQIYAGQVLFIPAVAFAHRANE